MTSINDFQRADGTTDWKAYEQAEINNGERCYQCKGFIGFSGRNGSRKQCYNCQNIENTEEWDDDCRLRCPKCKNVWDLNEQGDNGDLYSDDIHEVTCPECNYDFEIKTSVTYSFESPELLEESNGQ